MNSPIPPDSSPISQPEETSSNLASQASPPTGTIPVADTVTIDSARQQLAVTLARSRQDEFAARCSMSVK